MSTPFLKKVLETWKTQDVVLINGGGHDMDGVGLPARGTRWRFPQFLSDEKLGKESPKAGPSPALWNPPRGTGCPCVLLVSALGLVGSHGWRGTSTESTYFSGRQFFYPQGLTLVSRCSQRPEARLPAAGTPLLQDRPGRGNCLAIGPAAQGCLVWWQ